MTADSGKLLEKAERSFDAAQRLLKAGHVDFAADRAYYAMFYIAEALLADLGLHYSSHGAVHGAFGREFAKTERVEPRFHRLILNAFDKRQIGVYRVDAELHSDEVERMITEGREFHAAAREYLEKPA